MRALRALIFPGINLHARQRYKALPAFFGAAPPDAERRVLDAGSGNGMLAYKSFLLGNHVVGISFNASEVLKASTFFNADKGLPSTRLQFKQGNLYHLDFPEDHFDEIICSEVIEHLRDDVAVCRRFFQLLKPGGVLHLCAPNARHPYNETFPLDQDESGGHVRPGYTLESYTRMLEPIGFHIEATKGLGGPVRQAFNWRIKAIQAQFGASAGMPLFAAALPLLWLDNFLGVRTPFSLYVKAVKPAPSTPPVH